MPEVILNHKNFNSLLGTYQFCGMFYVVVPHHLYEQYFLYVLEKNSWRHETASDANFYNWDDFLEGIHILISFNNW